MAEFSNVQLEIDDLPKLEDQKFNGLHTNYLTVVLIFRVLVIFILLGGVAALSTEDMQAALWLGAGVLVFGGLFISAGYFGFYKKGYALREHDVSYKRGLIFHSTTVVPLNRIQHSELVRGPLDRLFGLSSVKIYTAGGSMSDITIPGLGLEVAEKIRNYITSKIQDQEDAGE